jgi:hypothetical protein
MHRSVYMANDIIKLHKIIKSSVVCISENDTLRVEEVYRDRGVNW